MSLSNQGSSKTPNSSLTGSSDSDPFSLERYVPLLDRSRRSRTSSTAASTGQLEHAPFSASYGFSHSVANESEAAEDVGEDHEDYQGQEYRETQGSPADLDSYHSPSYPGEYNALHIYGGEFFSVQEGSSSPSDGSSTSVTDSDQFGGQDQSSETTTLFDGLDLPLMAPFQYASSSIYSDYDTDEVGLSSPSSSPTLMPIPGFSPVTAADIADDLHPTRPITIAQPHSSGNGRTLSSQERDFDENIGRKGPREISYLEQYAIQQEEEAQELRQAAEEDEQREREAQRTPTATSFAPFAQLGDLARGVQEYAPSSIARNLPWVAQATEEMTGVAAEAAGAPGDDSPASSESSSDSSSSCSFDVPQFPEAAEGDHSANHPPAHDKMDYKQGRGYSEGFQDGYKKGKKFGYDEACDDQRPILSTYEEYLAGQTPEQSHQRGQPVKDISRNDGTIVTTDELMHEIESMMYRLRIPYKGADRERSHNELRRFFKDVGLQLFADENNKTSPQQESRAPRPISASPSELGQGRALPRLSRNASPPRSTTKMLEDFDDFLNDTSGRWEIRQQELREHELLARVRARAQATSPRHQSGGSILGAEEQAGQPASQCSPSASDSGRCEEGKPEKPRKSL